MSDEEEQPKPRTRRKQTWGSVLSFEANKEVRAWVDGECRARGISRTKFLQAIVYGYYDIWKRNQPK